MSEHDNVSELFAELDRRMNRKTPLNLWIKRVQANEQSFVDNPKRARRLVWMTGVRVVLFAATMLAVIWNSNLTGFATLLAPLLGAAACVAAMEPLVRALAYRNGWYAGRTALLDAYRDAERDGLNLSEWYWREWTHTMGLPKDLPRGGN